MNCPISDHDHIERANTLASLLPESWVQNSVTKQPLAPDDHDYMLKEYDITYYIMSATSYSL